MTVAASTARPRIAFLVANEGIEEQELLEPWDAVEKAGWSATLIAPKPGSTQLMSHIDKTTTRTVELTTAEASAADFDALVLPGGVVNADELRTDQPAVQFVREIFSSAKPCAVICHGPWALVEADVLRGRTITSWQSIKTDIANAGGLWVDQETAVDRNGPNVLLSSRSPADLPAFCASFLEVVGEAVGDHRSPHSDDIVDEAGRESFPASDPPAFNVA